MYGTYLEWCLTTLTTNSPISCPFDDRGTSHKFNGNFLKTVDSIHNHDNSGSSLTIMRLHPKQEKDVQLSATLTNLCNTFQSVLHLYPDRDSVLLCLNNYISKPNPDWWGKQFADGHIDPNLLYHYWPINKDSVSIHEIPTWVKREFLSFYLMPAWFDMLEWYHPDTWSHPNAHVVTVNSLLFDFENTLYKIQKHCGLEFVRPISDLVPYHQINLTHQLNIGQDQLCHSIVNAVLSEDYIEWSPLPLPSEAWIQWQLRNKGYEIRCHGLDNFPTNSVQLRELLYCV